MARNGVRFIFFFLLIFFVLISVQAKTLTTASDYYSYGNDLVTQGKLEDALQAFRTAGSMDQRTLDATYGLSYQTGWVLDRLGRYEESLGEFKNAENTHPDWISNYAIYYNEGCLLAKLGRNEEAIQKFDQALAIEYTNREAWFNKGIVLARMGRSPEAKEAFDRARKAYGSYVPLLGSYREAANTYDLLKGIPHTEPTPVPGVTRATAPAPLPAPTSNPALSVDLQMRKGSDFSSRYLYEDAVYAYDQVLVNDPANYQAMEAKGVALANLGRFDEALVMLNQAIPHLNSGSDESTYVDTWYVRGWVLANLGKYDDALDSFNKALVVDPDAFPAYYNMAWVLANKGDTVAAVVAYNRSLDWGNPQSLEVKSYSRIGPLGTYSDAADAIDRTTKERLIYQEDFSRDPHWLTDSPRQYSWDLQKQMFHFTSGENAGYAVVMVPYKKTSFRLEFDITIPKADPGTDLHIGLSSRNTMLSSQDAVLAEFKSWRAGTFKDLKDGDKTYQIIAYDNGNKKTDEESDYSCFINREDDKSSPTFGENRTYHVVVTYDKDKNTVTTKVSDNLHEKTYFNCAGMYDKLGGFENLDRIVLVATQVPNTSIDGYIDNVNLYALATSESVAPVVVPGPVSVAGITSAIVNTSSGTTPSGSSPDNTLPVIGAVILVIGCIAGTGLYLRHKSRKNGSPGIIEREKQPAVQAERPLFVLELDRTQMEVNAWHRLKITLKNIGKADALDVNFSFSSEFETRWIQPRAVGAGQTETFDNIAIHPNKKGEVPLVITLTFHDALKNEYSEKKEFFIDVTESQMPQTPHLTPGGSPQKFSPDLQLPPELSNQFTDAEFLGKGGFARVFKAKRKDGTWVAVKIPLSMDAATGKSFIAEMQNWKKLSHNNIVKLYDFNIMPLPYIEEELCDGALADLDKPIESEEAAWILFNICEGLKLAHAQKIIHRDLKPQNILLKSGVPKISDWGLSRIISEATTSTATSFTPYYAAPEQINNRLKDERTDIWQLGVILYQLVTGLLPFTGDSMIDVGMNIVTKDPRRPGEVRPEAHVMDAVVMKCLEKDPVKRYQSVLELQKDLAMYLRENYAELLKTSVTVQDYSRSAYYCGDLVMVNLQTGDIPAAYKYLLDLAQYSKGDVSAQARELSGQIKMRMDMGITEIPDELIQKAEIIVHKIKMPSK